MDHALRVIEGGINRWKNAERWPFPDKAVGVSLQTLTWASSFISPGMEQSYRSCGNFLAAHALQWIRIPATLGVVQEMLEAAGQGPQLTPQIKAGALVLSPLLFFVPRETPVLLWGPTAFLRDHLSEIGLIAQVVTACLYYRKGDNLSAVSAGLMAAQRTVEYFNMIPLEWQTALAVARYFSPQIFTFLKPLTTPKANPQAFQDAIIRTSVIVLGIILCREVSRFVFPQAVKIGPSDLRRYNGEKVVVDPELDLVKKIKSTADYNTLPEDAPVDRRLESWFYTELQRHRPSELKKGYWATQMTGSKLEREARMQTCSLSQAMEVLKGLPEELCWDWKKAYNLQDGINPQVVHHLMLMQVDFARQLA